jgi:pullulanase/glycogen debranching enzyme
MAERCPSVWPGEPYPLGATWDGGDVNFALFSEHAERVAICAFDERALRAETPIEKSSASGASSRRARSPH